MFRKVKLFVSTVKYLKPRQVLFQIKYRLEKVKNIEFYSIKYEKSEVKHIKFKNYEPVIPCYFGENKFSFLNIEYKFGKTINWEELEFGKLWNYNLQYCNWLLQENVEVNERLRLLKSLNKSLKDNQIVLEPYPVSLRVINVIRFISKNDLKEVEEYDFLMKQLVFLSKRLEFHVLGNHLLENAFALALGGEFFNKVDLLKKGISLILKELKEQILPDGAHFELSPMYHSIILFRVLEFIDWYSQSSNCNPQTLKEIKNVAQQMLGWAKQISFHNGNIPLFNDSANEIAYPVNWLISYGKDLGLNPASINLKECGYRSINLGNYEIKIDIAEIGANYQPGHAHADALSFVMNFMNKPVFVEQGTSTYQIGERRNLERSTSAHNTVVVLNKDQSEVWGGFRVGKRAHSKILKESNNNILASHDGYSDKGIIHKRSFDFSDHEIIIKDFLNKEDIAVKYLHLYPGLKIEKIENYFLIDEQVQLKFKGALNVEIEKYFFSDRFNKYEESVRFVVSFKNHLNTIIILPE